MCRAGKCFGPTLPQAYGMPEEAGKRHTLRRKGNRQAIIGLIRLGFCKTVAAAMLVCLSGCQKFLRRGEIVNLSMRSGLKVVQAGWWIGRQTAIAKERETK